jgi:hypothetical protein
MIDPRIRPFLYEHGLNLTLESTGMWYLRSEDGLSVKFGYSPGPGLFEHQVVPAYEQMERIRHAYRSKQRSLDSVQGIDTGPLSS